MSDAFLQRSEFVRRFSRALWMYWVTMGIALLSVAVALAPFEVLIAGIFVSVLGSLYVILRRWLPPIAKRLNERATVLHQNRDFEGARTLVGRALKIRRALYGSDSPLVAESLSLLGDVLTDLRDYRQAQLNLELALSIFERADAHLRAAATRQSLGVLFFHQGNFTPARSLLEQALSTYEREPENYDTDHHTALILNNLGRTLWKQGDLAGARAVLERALGICERVVGRHPLTARVLYNLAGVNAEGGFHRSAQLLLQRALPIFEQELGPEDSDTVLAREALESLRGRVGL